MDQEIRKAIEGLKTIVETIRTETEKADQLIEGLVGKKESEVQTDEIVEVLFLYKAANILAHQLRVVISGKEW